MLAKNTVIMAKLRWVRLVHKCRTCLYLFTILPACSAQALRREFFFETRPAERFANVVFVIHLRRRYTFYIMNVILPSLMTSVLLLSVFFCTPAQKVQIGVVVLLSFRIFLLNVTDSIPRTSDHIPVLGESVPRCPSAASFSLLGQGREKD